MDAARRGVGPLAALERLLLASGPPSVSALLELLVDFEAYHDFLLLVEQYLPERLDEVKRLPNAAARIDCFANHFRDRYFPLAFSNGDYIDPDVEYNDLLRAIPIPYSGVEWDDIHEVEHWRDGYLLMGSLQIYDQFSHLDEGMGQVWIEACGFIVDQEQLMRLPDEGWSSGELHHLLDGTDYEGAAVMADWMRNDTGNAFLDAHVEYPLTDGWDPETVEILTADWQKSEVLTDQMSRLADWLEEDPTPNYTQMLDFLLAREQAIKQGTPPSQPLSEVFRDEEENS